MSKKALIDAVADQFDSRAAAERAVDAVIDGIDTVVREGGMVVLPKWGTFRQRLRKERPGRNPRTGESTGIIPARTVLAFQSKRQF